MKCIKMVLISAVSVYSALIAVTPALANSTTDLLTRPNVALEIVKPNGQTQLLFLVADGTYTVLPPYN